MLSEENFLTKAKLRYTQTVDGNFDTLNELQKSKSKPTREGYKLVILYASDKEQQHSYIEAAKAKGLRYYYRISIIFALDQKLESSNRKYFFAFE